MMKHIIEQMAGIVEDTMTTYKTDFYTHDKKSLEQATPDSLPYIWIVAPGHTHLLRIGEYTEKLLTDRRTQYFAATDVKKGTNPWRYYSECFAPRYGERAFVIYRSALSDEILMNEIDAYSLKLIPQIEFDRAMRLFTKVGGTLPKRLRMPVKFANTSLDVVKEKIRECERHGNTSLRDCLRRFQNYSRDADDQFIEVSFIPSWNEFTFVEVTDGQFGLNGAIVFHGWPETGYQENFSHQIEKRYGWSTHT